MITEIGVAAGEIWTTLESSEELSVDALGRTLNRDSEMILMAVGWLCREGFCNAVMREREIFISLRQKSITN